MAFWSANKILRTDSGCHVQCDLVPEVEYVFRVWCFFLCLFCFVGIHVAQIVVWEFINYLV